MRGEGESLDGVPPLSDKERAFDLGVRPKAVRGRPSEAVSL